MSDKKSIFYTLKCGSSLQSYKYRHFRHKKESHFIYNQLILLIFLIYELAFNLHIL